MSDTDGSLNDVHASRSPSRKRSQRLARQEPALTPSRSQRPRRQQTQEESQPTYKEDTTDEEEFTRVQEVSDGDAVAQPRPKRQRVSRPTPSKSATPRPQRRQQPGAIRKPRTAQQDPQRAQWIYERYDSAARRQPPYFETLPFQIWTQIFEYASTPLFDPLNPRDWVNRRWLAQACRTCKLLLDPAVTALYKAPPIANVYAPHEVFDLLMTDASQRQTSKLGFDINYNAKVQRLEFDANTLAYTAHGRGRFDLSLLIPVMPQLHTIRISSVFDLPANLKMQRSTKWNYPDNLVPVLNEHKRRLRSFEWHQKLCSKDQDLHWLKSVHYTDAFQTAKDLKLSGFHRVGVTRKPNSLQVEALGLEEQLAGALAALPVLESLEFEACTILNEELLPLLPTGLQALHINDCEFFDSAMLGSFLAERGAQLRSLILEHNKSLDIRFLPGLKSSCPQLELLKIDLNYYNSHRTYVDSGPKYTDLLAEDDVPSWPSRLRTVELLHLRNWTDGAARTFFKSLIDSADQLPDLRSLTVKAILSLGWRERKAFRNEWVPKLERVFLRKAKLPDRHFVSISEGRAWLDKLKADPRIGETGPAVIVPATRNLPTPPSDDEAASEPSRLRPRKRRAHYSESSDDEAAAPPVKKSLDMSSLAVAAREAMEKHIQGMCDIVDVTVDNLRPAEKQWSMGDFLDSEPSDDEEWDPDAGDTGELYDGWAA